MNQIPHAIEWVPVNSLSSGSYREILILTHKHSMQDWRIIHGWIDPNDGYTNFRIMGKSNGIGKSYPDVEIPKNEIIAVGIFPHYGYLV